MKKRGILAALICSVCLIASSVVPVMADATRVVTLGADLTDAQKNTMMNYFKADPSQVQILTVTNQDEINHLSSYIPMEQIGTRTLSCAYVRPTQSGGIKVRTANLTWVTCNMIATTLSTSGVTNCEVIAACPFEVSGTGALTGVIMAYEAAVGQELDQTKKELATEEMVVTGDLAMEIGQKNAINIMNEAKMQVIGDNVQNADEIYNIVYNIAMNSDAFVTAEQLEEITSLLSEIAQQNYDYELMKETLENVEGNVAGDVVEEDVADEFDEESILDAELDASILGDSVIESFTEDPTLEDETRAEASGEEVDEDVVYEESGDVYVEDVYAEDVYMEETSADELNTDHLSDENKARFERAKKFCAGEFEGDTASLQSELGPDAYTTVMLDYETGAAVSKLVLKAYLEVLTEGPESYVFDGTEKYWTTELNMIEDKLEVIFGMDGNVVADALVNIPVEVLQQMFDETMHYFEFLYDEVTEDYTEEYVEEAYTEEHVEEYTEDVYTEEYIEEVPMEYVEEAYVE